MTAESGVEPLAEVRAAAICSGVAGDIRSIERSAALVGGNNQQNARGIGKHSESSIIRLISNKQLLEAEQVLNGAITMANQSPNNYLALCSRIQAIQSALDALRVRVIALNDAKKVLFCIS
jgi:NifB/MoaA-like Fe-S oxidoreductase